MVIERDKVQNRHYGLAVRVASLKALAWSWFREWSVVRWLRVSLGHRESATALNGISAVKWTSTLQSPYHRLKFVRPRGPQRFNEPVQFRWLNLVGGVWGRACTQIVSDNESEAALRFALADLFEVHVEHVLPLHVRWYRPR